MNLTICLLSMKRYVAREDIRRYVQGYSDVSEAAFERMFERDKEELRRIGVPVEVGSNDALFDDEIGYRIRPADFELPGVELSAEEAAVVGVAARAWRQTTMASATVSALTKLRGAGVEPTADRLPRLEPVVTATEPGFETWYEAVLNRQRVRFHYAGRGLRTIEPWRLTSQRGRWYVLGADRDRGAPRMFRLSRVEGLPELLGAPGAFDLPTDIDFDALSSALEAPSDTAELQVAIRHGRAPALRRRARAVELPALGELAIEFDGYAVGYASNAIVGELVSYGADVIVLDPPELRDLVIAQLSAVARQSPTGPAPAPLERMQS